MSTYIHAICMRMTFKARGAGKRPAGPDSILTFRFRIPHAFISPAAQLYRERAANPIGQDLFFLHAETPAEQ